VTVEANRHATPQARDYLERNGWEEQDDESWILPGIHEWGMSLTQALRAQERRDQWGH
jgi:hypothetical protein